MTRILLTILILLFFNYPAYALDNGFELDDEFQINIYNYSYQDYPQVVSIDARYLVLWEDAQRHGLYGRPIGSDGGLIGDEEFLVYSGNSAQKLSMASDGTNCLVAFIAYTETGTSDIYSQLIDASGNKISTPKQVNTWTDNYQYEPFVASNGNGYLVTWQSKEQDNDGHGVYAQFMDNDGNKTGSEFRINSYTQNDQSGASIAPNGSGYFVVWNSVEQDGSYEGVYGRFVDNDTPNDSEFLINTCTSNRPKDSYVTTDGTKFLVVWVCWDRLGVYGQFIGNDGSKIGSEFKIDTGPNYNQYEPTIAFNGAYYLVTWCRNGSLPHADIYCQIISNDETGTKIGSEFKINDYTDNIQYNPTIASIGLDFFVAWDSRYPYGNRWRSRIIGRNLQAQQLLITHHPQNQTITQGQDVMFHIDALSSGGDIHYQWYINGNPAGDDADSLTMTAVALDNDDAVIYCDVSDDQGTVQSESAVLTVIPLHFFQVLDMTPIPNSELTHSPEQIIIEFNDVLNTGSLLGNQNMFRKAGNDEMFDTDDDTVIPVTTSFDLDQKKLTIGLADAYLPNDTYQLTLTGLLNTDADLLDGEYDNDFPSGDSVPGGDFIARFTILRSVKELILNDNDTITISWYSFRPDYIYQVEESYNLTNDNWLSVEPVSQWPTEELVWTGHSHTGDGCAFYRVTAIVPYIESIAPSSNAQSALSLSIDIVGYDTEFQELSTTVSLGGGITVNSVTVQDSSHITVDINIDPGAEPGYRDVCVAIGSTVYIKENAFEITE